MPDEQEPHQLKVNAMGTPSPRRDAPQKVTGRAPYAMDYGADGAEDEGGYPVPEPLHAMVVTSRVARGRITSVGAAEVAAIDGVLTVLDHTNAPELSGDDRELLILQSDEVHFRGEIVAIVVAETSEAAREAARRLVIDYDEEPHCVNTGDVEPVRPDGLNGGFKPDSNTGRVDLVLASSERVVDQTYRTVFQHNNPMEPHGSTVRWSDQDDEAGAQVEMYDSTQAVHSVRSTLAPMFGIDPQRFHVRAPYVGGGFGSKGLPHAHNVAALMAARAHPDRWVRLALTRQQMFSLTGYRTDTEQQFRLAADAQGSISGIDHTVLEQSSAIKEYGEQTAETTRHFYAAPNRHTSHRVAMLDVSVPSWVRAPGVMPGMFAQEVAMDELAVACDLDPIELRRRNEPETDPESGKPFGVRRLTECLDLGAELFGWADRDHRPGQSVEGDWLIGTGVAASTYPVHAFPGNQARVTHYGDGRYEVAIGATDIGTGAGTVLAQIAADALGVDVARVEMRIGATDVPRATVAGGSSGTASWGSAIVNAAQTFRDVHGEDPEPAAVTTAGMRPNPNRERFSLHSFGAQFAEVRVNRWTGELRATRLLGYFSAGRIINPLLARSQLVGGMIMGLSGALFEESWRDPRYGHFATADLASYHIAAHADVPAVEAHWLPEEDLRANPMGLHGIGEIGIVGTAAAVANAAWHATGVRARSLPITADTFLEHNLTSSKT